MNVLLKKAVFSAAMSFCAWACVQDIKGYAPTGPLHYPVDVVASPTLPLVYVLNSNFDQRFNTGSVSVLRIDPSSGFAPAEDGGLLIQRLLIPSLGAQLAIDPAGGRLAVSHRGLGMITLFEINPVTGLLSCAENPNSLGSRTQEQENTSCDAQHFISIDGGALGVEDSAVFDVYPVSFAQAPHASGSGVQLSAGFLTNGSLWKGVFAEGAQRVSEVSSAAFPGAVASVSVAQHPGTQSRYTSVAGRWSDGSNNAAALFMYDVGTSSSDALRTRTVRIGQEWGGTVAAGVVFSSDGTRAYVLAQNPGALLTLDTTTVSVKDDTGAANLWPSMRILHTLALDGRPMDIAYASSGAQEWVAVAHYEHDAVSFYNVGSGVPVLHRRMPAGKGSMSASFVAHDGRTYCVVTGFIDHSLSVFVFDPSSKDFTLLKKVRNETVPLGDR